METLPGPKFGQKLHIDTAPKSFYRQEFADNRARQRGFDGSNGYKRIVGSTLGEVLKQDVELLPEELRGGVFARNFDYRAKAASRTWKKTYAQENLLQLAPIGVVKKDFNFSLAEKRILGVVYEVKDEDNIKQDLSIDVYGRKKEESKEDQATVIASLYNV